MGIGIIKINGTYRNLVVEVCSERRGRAFSTRDACVSYPAVGAGVVWSLCICRSRFQDCRGFRVQPW